MSHPAEAQAHPEEHAHPAPGTYAKVAVTLVILTALEVAVYYVESIRTYLVPILVVLMAIKFALVAMFYMHLKFDLKILRWLFGFSLVIAAVVIMALFTLFTYNRTLWWWGGVPW